MAIRLDNIKNKKQHYKAQQKRSEILKFLTSEPKTAVQLAEETKIAEVTLRHHLNRMEKYAQLKALAKKNVFGDSAKRYFSLDADISIYNDEYARNTPQQIYYRKIADMLMGNPKTKPEIADMINATLKRTHDIVRELHQQGYVKMVMIKNVPWRAESKHYYHPDSDPEQLELRIKLIEMRFKHMTREEYTEMIAQEKPYEPPVEVPDLPSNLLAMMGYTTQNPKEGKRFNVDEYSAKHPDWNKYQARQGVQYSNIGCAMQMMIESAPGVI